MSDVEQNIDDELVAIIDDWIAKLDGPLPDVSGFISPRKATSWRQVQNLDCCLDKIGSFHDPVIGQGSFVKVSGSDPESLHRGVKSVFYLSTDKLMRLVEEFAREDDWFRAELDLRLRKISLDEETKLMREQRDGE